MMPNMMILTTMIYIRLVLFNNYQNNLGQLLFVRSIYTKAMYLHMYIDNKWKDILYMYMYLLLKKQLSYFDTYIHTCHTYMSYIHTYIHTNIHTY